MRKPKASFRLVQPVLFIARRELDALKRVLESTGAKAEAKFRSSLLSLFESSWRGTGRGSCRLGIFGRWFCTIASRRMTEQNL